MTVAVKIAKLIVVVAKKTVDENLAKLIVVEVAKKTVVEKVVEITAVVVAEEIVAEEDAAV